MKINITNVKDILIKLEESKNSYENVYYAYYNIIKDVAELWNNGVELQLMENVEKEKKDMNYNYNDLNDFNDVFNYICTRYSFANNIMLNKNEETKIINAMNGCINRLNKINRLLSSVDKSELNNYQLNILNNVIHCFKQEINNKAVELKNSLVSNFNNIRRIERDIKEKLEKTTIHIIKETDTSITKTRIDNNIVLLDHEELEKISSLLKLQITEEMKIIKNINSLFVNLKNNYVSDNTYLFEELSNLIIYNLNNNKNNHYYNVYLIDQRITEVKEKMAAAKRIDENANIGTIDGIV